MGDRGNIAFIDRRTVGDQKVVGYTFLYTHWGGSEIAEVLADTLKRRERWDDNPYLCRMVFCRLVKGSEDHEGGYGISAFIGDNQHSVLVVDTDNGMVRRYKESEIDLAALEHKEPGRPIGNWSFEDFIAYVDSKKTEDE